MRGISEDRLVEKLGYTDQPSYEDLLCELIDECQELQEPWVPLDEFLKSDFQGLCWIAVRSGSVYPAMKIGSKFIDDLSLGTYIYPINITHVMPIPKPEPPK